MKSVLVIPEMCDEQLALQILRTFSPLLIPHFELFVVYEGNLPPEYTKMPLSNALKSVDISLYIFPSSDKGRFYLEAVQNSFKIYFSDNFPTPAELESYLLQYLYSENKILKKLAEHILDTWCAKSKIILCMHHFKSSQIERENIISVVTARFKHRGPIIILDKEESDKITSYAEDPFANVWIFAASRGKLDQVTLLLEIKDLNKEVHVIGPEGYLTPFSYSEKGFSPSISVLNNHHIDEQIFSRLANRNSVSSWYLYPYGYGLLQTNGIGPTNSFGFRVGDISQYEFNKRGPDEKLIIFFGGSAVHALEVPYESTMSQVLQRELNLRTGGKFKVTVLNFGLSGHVLLNQIITYTIFCHKLKPDMVISHDGANDLICGMINDPKLVSEYQVVYPANFEQWGQMLQGTTEIPLTREYSSEIPMQPINQPNAVVESYLNRKQQFCELVNNNSGDFIWALQPCAFSKPQSAAEREAMASFNNTLKAYHELYRRLPFLYDICRKQGIGKANATYLDLHSEFGKLSINENCFSDIVHMTENGNKICADLYTQLITNGRSWKTWSI